MLQSPIGSQTVCIGGSDVWAKVVEAAGVEEGVDVEAAGVEEGVYDGARVVTGTVVEACSVV